jgi:ArsR family transcriptional regulator
MDTLSVGIYVCKVPEADKRAVILTAACPFDISRDMEPHIAVRGLSALAQESRLKVFRLLIQRGPDGMAAGNIARQLKVPNNTLSAHLAVLSRAGLVSSRKQGRSIIYSVDFEGTSKLLSFLVEDCCGGKPDICRPLIASALAECCAN